MSTLYVIHHSPWSERARWALLHHRLAFEEREHVPLVGEFALRLRAKRRTGKVSVPLLVSDDGEAVQGSLAIGEWADAHGKGARLFPADGRGTIVALYEAAEDSLCAARERFTRQLATDREAQLASLPRSLRGLPFASLGVRLGSAFIVRKYQANLGAVDDRMRAGLCAVRAALGEKRYVLAELSFGDLVGASLVQVVEPVSDAYLRLPPATRRLWRHEKLAKEFADLVAWRDALYAEHRPRPTR